MKKSGRILLGYGLGYIILSGVVLVQPDIEIPEYIMFALNVSAFLFALAEFCGCGGKYYLLLILQKILCRYLNQMLKLTDEIRKERELIRRNKNKIKFLTGVCVYAEHKIAEHDLKGIGPAAGFFYICASVSIVILIVIPVSKIFSYSNSLMNAMSIAPLGTLIINIYYESEYKLRNKEFVNKIAAILKKINENADSFEAQVKNIYE